MDLKTVVRSIPDYPKPGILFRDVTTLFQDAEALKQLTDDLVKSLEGKQVDLVVGPEARGFVVGAALAYALGAGLVLVLLVFGVGLIGEGLQQGGREVA